MKNVFVNGYGSIGSRIAEFIKDDSEINVIGVGKHSPDEKVDLAKIEALELTNDQIIAFDKAQEKLNNELGSIKLRIKSGELSREEAKIAFEVIHKENKDALSKIWTDKQVEIIKIHRFLEMRWHLKKGEIRGKDKEGKGDRGG